MEIARLSDLTSPTACPRLVVKVGSSLLVDAQGVRELPRAPKLALARQLVAEIAARLPARSLR